MSSTFPSRVPYRVSPYLTRGFRHVPTCIGSSSHRGSEPRRHPSVRCDPWRERVGRDFASWVTEPRTTRVTARVTQETKTGVPSPFGETADTYDHVRKPAAGLPRTHLQSRSQSKLGYRNVRRLRPDLDYQNPSGSPGREQGTGVRRSRVAPSSTLTDPKPRPLVQDQDL